MAISNQTKQGNQITRDNKTTRGNQTWTLWPNRSLDRRGVMGLIAFFSILLLAGVVRSLVLGAWPVALFLLFDLAAVGLALYISVTRARWQETIALTPNRLIITKSLGDAIREVREIKPDHAQLRLAKLDGRQRLEVGDGRHTISIGSFLTEEDLQHLLADIQTALEDWQRQPMAASKP